MTLDDVPQIIGQVFLYGLAPAGIFFLGCRRIVESWVEGLFKQRQQEFEHEHAKELQRLKVKIDTAIQGAIRMHDREFTLLPDMWAHVSEAFSLARWLCSPMQQYASLRYMSAPELEEFLSKTELWESQKDKLRTAKDQDRDRLWQDMDMWQRYNKVKAAMSSADKLVKVNGVFLPDDLRALFNELIAVVWEALIAYETGSQISPKDYKMMKEGWTLLQGKGTELHKALEDALRRRLLAQAAFAEN